MNSACPTYNAGTTPPAHGIVLTDEQCRRVAALLSSVRPTPKEA